MAITLSKRTGFLWGLITKYHETSYWRMREYIVHHPTKLKSRWYLFRIKRTDAWNNASLGTHLGQCAVFKSKPYLPHGLNGIIISNEAVIGRECIIYHQVTVGGGNGGSPTIGDHVELGAGAKVVGPIHIGDYARIGAGCVVSVDVPANCTVVMPHPRIIQR